MLTAKPEPVFTTGLSQSLGSKLKHLYNFPGKLCQDFCLSLIGIH